ncbi:MAG: gamma-glutamyltransferase, partial [Xanthomonadales bacterium]|nr:gamma-glutamyltransferase [Xanthomonadales bacterium]
MIRTLAFIAVLFHSCAFAAAADPTWGRDGMVVTSVSPAAPAGRLMLERGGNAVDAAVATAFAAAVAHPFSSGLGGGLFAVVHDASGGVSTTLDARETAPASADPEFYRNNPESIRRGKHSVGVPGFVQGAWALHQRFGSLPWAELIEPAIALAENGVPVSVWHNRMVSYAVPSLEEFPETRRIQTVDGAAPPLGYLLKQADLAKTLRRIASDGANGFYSGKLARQLVKGVRDGGGIWSRKDLKTYRSVERLPVVLEYHGWEIVSAPPP